MLSDPTYTRIVDLAAGKSWKRQDAEEITSKTLDALVRLKDTQQAKLLLKVESILLRDMGSFNCENVANCTWALAKLGHVQWPKHEERTKKGKIGKVLYRRLRNFYRRLETVITRKMRDFSSQDLSR